MKRDQSKSGLLVFTLQHLHVFWPCTSVLIYNKDQAVWALVLSLFMGQVHSRLRPSLLGVAGFWKWVDDWGGEPDWGVQRGFLPRNKDRKTLFNHHARHTVNCVHCLKASILHCH